MHNSEQKRVLKQIIFHINLDDMQYLNDLTGHQEAWQYVEEESIHEKEVGRIKTNNAIFKFYAMID